MGGMTFSVAQTSVKAGIGERYLPKRVLLAAKIETSNEVSPHDFPAQSTRARPLQSAAHSGARCRAICRAHFLSLSIYSKTYTEGSDPFELLLLQCGNLLWQSSVTLLARIKEDRYEEGTRAKC